MNPLAMQARRPLARTLLAGLACVLLGACGGDERGPYPLEPGRERPQPDRAVPAGATALERLGVRDELGRPLLVPTLPPGWQQLPPAAQQRRHRRRAPALRAAPSPTPSCGAMPSFSLAACGGTRVWG